MPVVDLESTVATWPGDWSANFNGPDVALTSVPYPQVLTATPGDRHETVNWRASSAVSLASGHKMGFAVPLSGAHDQDLGILFAGHVAVHAGPGSPGIGVAVFVGRAASGTLSTTRTSAQNQLAQFAYLPSQVHDHGDVLSASYLGSWLTDKYAEASFGTNPILFGFELMNYSGGALSLTQLSFTITGQRYLKDYDTFEPAR